jgi:hypothetical protein
VLPFEAFRGRSGQHPLGQEHPCTDGGGNDLGDEGEAVDDASANVAFDVIVEVGRGYRTVEEVSNRKVYSDMIAVDAIFSPVQRVRYKVENTRVGQMTDLDKLVITVDTDGTITPKDAFEEASAILVNQYTALAGQTKVEASAPLTASNVDSSAGGEGDDSPALMTSIEDLNLSARTTNALVNNDIHTLKDLFSLSDAELRDLKGFGSKALDEVKEKISPEAFENLQKWLNEEEFAVYKPEIESIIQSQDWKDLDDAFYTHIRIGTGGIRGKLGPGPNRINLRTIGEAAQGLANFIEDFSPDVGGCSP